MNESITPDKVRIRFDELEGRVSSLEAKLSLLSCPRCGAPSGGGVCQGCWKEIGLPK